MELKLFRVLWHPCFCLQRARGARRLLADARFRLLADARFRLLADAGCPPLSPRPPLPPAPPSRSLQGASERLPGLQTASRARLWRLLGASGGAPEIGSDRDFRPLPGTSSERAGRARGHLRDPSSLAQLPSPRFNIAVAWPKSLKKHWNLKQTGGSGGL